MGESPLLEQTRRILIDTQVSYARLYAAALAILKEYKAGTDQNSETFNQVIKRLQEELDL